MYLQTTIIMRSKRYLFAKMAIFLWVAMGGALLGVNKVIAQTHCTSIGTGNWSAVFGCNAAASGTKYVVAAGDTVTVANNVSTIVDTLEVYGSLVFISGRKIEMALSGIVIVQPGGSVSGGNSGAGFRFGGTHSIVGAFNVSGSAYGDSATSTFTTGNPLPVSWLSLSARFSEDRLFVDWATASETNNQLFEVEISDGTSDFYPVQTTYSKADAGMSNRVLYYNESITLPVELEKAKWVYVRVKQVDFDGAFEYSKTIAVQREKQDQVNVMALDRQINVELPYASSGIIRIHSTSGSLKHEVLFGGDLQHVSVEEGVYIITIQTEHFEPIQRKLVVYP